MSIGGAERMKGSGSMAESEATADQSAPRERTIIEKCLRRVKDPSILWLDCRWTMTHVRDAYLAWYLAYHERRQSPGRVFRIPRRRCKMWLPISWGETVVQRRFGLFEPWTFEILERVVKPGMVAIELGACYGEFTIHLSHLVGREGRVHAFEPFPPYFSIAQRNVQLNRLHNVELLNQAAGPASLKEVVFNPEAIHPYASLDQISQMDYASAGKVLELSPAKAVRIACVSLRQWLERQHITMDLLFMDIEGCEIEVLKDIEPLVRGQGKQPIVLLEHHHAFYRPGDYQWLESLFRESGYTVTRIVGHVLCLPGPTRTDKV